MSEDVEGHSFPKNPISILILSSSWNYDGLGLPLVTRSLVRNLRQLDPASEVFSVTCAVLKDEDKIDEKERKDAEEFKVELKGARQPWGKERKANVKWLDERAVLYYRHLIKKNRYDFIIGHMPHFGNGCLNLRDLSREIYEGHSPKVILVAHALPTTDEGGVDEDFMLLWLEEVDLVLSLNYNIQAQIEKYLGSLSTRRPISHRLYLPGLPAQSWKTFFTKPSLGGEQNILLMATDRRSLLMSALNFELHVLSDLQACHDVLRNVTSEVDLSRPLSFKMTMLVTSTDEKVQWQMRFKNMI